MATGPERVSPHAEVPTSGDQSRGEWLKCKLSSAYFIDTYCYIYDATLGEWIPFKLWVEQMDALQDLDEYKKVVALKARQLGMTWLILCYILWKAIFHPAFTALVFSRRETEAIYLLSTERLRGIYNRLPEWAQVRQIVTDSSHVWSLSNGSVVYGFPTTAGDSYTAGFVFIDEADLVPDLDKLMNAVKPTIDGGGQIVLLSRSEKSVPGSMFKKTYLGARAGKNGWKDIFLPWFVRPERDQKWYEEQKADILYRTGALDDLYQQYPATPEEALAPPTLDRRVPYPWLKQCYFPIEPIPVEEQYLDIPYLTLYKKPDFYGEYVIAADPAEGNPTSDDSVIHVLDANNGEECAVVAGKIEPKALSGYINQLSKWYNNAKILPERNNHGHAVILSLDETYETSCMAGWDDRPGWFSSNKGKALSYDTMVPMLRDHELIIHNEMTFNQLASIDGATLRAPEGEMDDYAVSFVLAAVAKKWASVTVEESGENLGGYRG